MNIVTAIRQHAPSVLADDFIFLEGPRWRADRLWVLDLFDGKLYTVSQDGVRSMVGSVPHRPAGIGFLANGTPVVVSMRDRRILKLVDGRLSVLADLSALVGGDLNDLISDDQGRIYVGNFGYDFHKGAPAASTNLIVVEPDGTVRTGASGLDFPNGMAIINGGKTFVVAETWVRRLTAFDRAPDGTLTNRRLFADLGDREPDGICADAEGGIWAACFNTGEVVRVVDGGAVTDRVLCGQHAISCQLGGADGRTLFCSAYLGSFEDLDASKRLGVLLTTRVETPGVAFASN